MALPDLNNDGDLPPGLHRANLEEVAARFGAPSPKRRRLVERLRRIHGLATSTGKLARFVVFGSFVTAKPEPNDVDVFLIMSDEFDVSTFTGEPGLLFDHPAAQSYFGASVFWIRRLAALGGETAAVEHWQLKRNGELRGIVEVIP